MSVSATILAAALPVFDLATNSIAERIAGVDPAVCLSRFGDYPPSKGKLGFPRCLWEKPFPANEKFWLKDVDFSCASPWSDESGSVRAGTLISKRHVIFAKHFPLWKGVRILFVGKDGEVCPCRIVATKALEKCDIAIGLLDYEVTPNIHPAKVLPEDCAKWIGDGRGLPIVTFNQREQVFLSECRGITTNSISNVASTHAEWNALGGKIVTGDSGNPAFLLIGNEPILLYCLQTGGVGHGPAIHRYRREIQKTMDELCPGYALEAFDFRPGSGGKRTHVRRGIWYNSTDAHTDEIRSEGVPGSVRLLSDGVRFDLRAV